MTANPQSERKTRRIILLRGKKPEILLSTLATGATLPEVQIPCWQRVAENLTVALSESCGIKAVSLSSLETPPKGKRSRQIGYEIMEACLPYDDAPDDRRWMAFDSLTQVAFRDPSDFQAVGQAIAQTTSIAEDSKPNPFGNFGWFHNLTLWVQGEIGKRGLHLGGRFRQLNAGATFSLVRFETDGPAVWFKAVGPPNHREYPVTLTLARLFPRFLPEIIAVRPECNGWLALEAEGALLRDCYRQAAWESVAAELAELQIDSLGTNLPLLDVGVYDLRARTLADLVGPFFDAMTESMGRQTKMSPAVLTGGELRNLSARVQNTLAFLDETSIPNTLGHLDINPGNVICLPAGCVFLDWAEAFVGHPFLTFQFLLEHLRQLHPADRRWESKIISTYAERWQRLVSPADVVDSMAITPLLALFAYLVSGDFWQDPIGRRDPAQFASLRSLTLRMKREADSLPNWTLRRGSPSANSQLLPRDGRQSQCSP